MSNSESTAPTDAVISIESAPPADATPIDKEPAIEEEEEEDEEDNLFTSIENSETAVKSEQQYDGHDAAHAPKLLKDAITKGEVDVDESEAEDEKEEKKGEETVHHRVSLVMNASFL